MNNREARRPEQRPQSQPASQVLRRRLWLGHTGDADHGGARPHNGQCLLKSVAAHKIQGAVESRENRFGQFNTNACIRWDIPAKPIPRSVVPELSDFSPFFCTRCTTDLAYALDSLLQAGSGIIDLPTRTEQEPGQ